MPLPPSDQRVRAYKRESAATGGDDAQARAWPVVANPQEDALDVRGVFFQEGGTDDAEAAIWRDGGVLYFRDANVGPGAAFALGTLAAAGGGGALTSDADHGNRGGGSLHALAVAGGLAGFLSGTDKARIDALWYNTAGIYAAAGHDHAGVYAPAAHVGAGAAAHAVATQQAHGFLSSYDKVAIDYLSANHSGAYQHPLAIAAGAAGYLSGTDKDRIDKLWSGQAGVYSTFADAGHSHLIPRIAYSIDNQTGSLTTTAAVLTNTRSACTLSAASAYRFHVTLSARVGNVYVRARITPSGGSAIDLNESAAITLTQTVFSSAWITLPYLSSTDCLIELWARTTSAGTSTIAHFALEVR